MTNGRPSTGMLYFDCNHNSSSELRRGSSYWVSITYYETELQVSLPYPPARPTMKPEPSPTIQPRLARSAPFKPN